MTASEDQVNVPVRNIMIEDMMGHAAERSNTRTCADKEQVFLNRLRQSKYALRSPERQLAAHLHLIEQIICAGATFQQYDHQLDGIGAVGPGSNGIATHPLVGLLVDGKVQGDKLTWFKVKGNHGWKLYPESPGQCCLMLDAGDLTGLPRLKHSDEFKRDAAVVHLNKERIRGSALCSDN